MVVVMASYLSQPESQAIVAAVAVRNPPGLGETAGQCLSQDLETGCLKLAVVKFLGVLNFKGDHNILISKP